MAWIRLRRNGAWVEYKGTTSVRKLYYRAYEAMRTGRQSFYVFEYAQRKWGVNGLRVTLAELNTLKCESMDGIPKLQLPPEIVLEKRMSAKTTAPNPKALYGDKKPSLDLLPLAGQLAQWEAHQDGSNKYGFLNFRDSKVEARTYINAALRHLQLYANGEARARDTEVLNLGAVMACCAILIDAEAHDMLIDNRVHSKVACDLLHEAEGMVQKLREAQEARDLEKKQREARRIEHPWSWINFGDDIPDLTGYHSVEVRYAGMKTTEVVRVDYSKYVNGINWAGVRTWRRYDG